MYCEPGRLVQHQEVVIFVKNEFLDPVGPHAARWRPAARIGLPHRGHTNLVAGDQAITRLRPATIDPNLAAANQPIHMRSGNTFKARQKEIIEPATGFVFAGGDTDRPGYNAGHRNTLGCKGLSLCFALLAPIAAAIVPDC